MIARALASESDASFLNVTLSTLEAKYYGETPKIIKAVFQVAKEKAPCILFFDEIDGIMRKRTEDEQSHTYGLKTEFLQALDNLLRNSTDAVFVIACTNHESALDKAVVRRFSNRYTCRQPVVEMGGRFPPFTSKCNTGLPCLCRTRHLRHSKRQRALQATRSGARLSSQLRLLLGRTFSLLWNST